MKISIVMPLYNAEKYLEECIESILAQTEMDFELICINDASTDSTVELINEYAKKDTRISVYTNEQRMGAGESRNIGLRKAQGKYIFFLDGDDIFDENMLYETWKTAEAKDADIVVYQYRAVSSEQIHKKIRIVQNDDFIKKYCHECFCMMDLKPFEILNFHSAPWDKMYRREFLLNENIWFQDLPNCNDTYFSMISLMLASKIVMLNDSRVMVYARQHNAQSRISTNRNPMCAYLADKKIAETLLEKKKMPILYKHYYTNIYCHLLSYLQSDMEETKKRDFYKFLKMEGIEHLKDYGKDFYLYLDEYIKEGFSNFSVKEYESAWFQTEGDRLDIFLNANSEKICSLFTEWRQEGKKIGLWGVGHIGEAFLRFCYRNNLYIDAIMDNDINKRDKQFWDFPLVSSIDKLYDKIHVILISSELYQEEIRKQIKEYSSDIIIISVPQILNKRVF